MSEQVRTAEGLMHDISITSAHFKVFTSLDQYGQAEDSPTVQFQHALHIIEQYAVANAQYDAAENHRIRTANFPSSALLSLLMTHTDGAADDIPWHCFRALLDTFIKLVSTTTTYRINDVPVEGGHNGSNSGLVDWDSQQLYKMVLFWTCHVALSLQKWVTPQLAAASGDKKQQAAGAGLQHEKLQEHKSAQTTRQKKPSRQRAAGAQAHAAALNNVLLPWLQFQGKAYRAIASFVDILPQLKLPHGDLQDCELLLMQVLVHLIPSLHTSSNTPHSSSSVLKHNTQSAQAGACTLLTALLRHILKGHQPLRMAKFIQQLSLLDLQPPAEPGTRHMLHMVADAICKLPHHADEDQLPSHKMFALLVYICLMCQDPARYGCHNAGLQTKAEVVVAYQGLMGEEQTEWLLELILLLLPQGAVEGVQLDQVLVELRMFSAWPKASIRKALIDSAKSALQLSSSNTAAAFAFMRLAVHDKDANTRARAVTALTGTLEAIWHRQLEGDDTIQDLDIASRMLDKSKTVRSKAVNLLAELVCCDIKAAAPHQEEVFQQAKLQLVYPCLPALCSILDAPPDSVLYDDNTLKVAKQILKEVSSWLCESEELVPLLLGSGSVTSTCQSSYSKNTLTLITHNLVPRNPDNTFKMWQNQLEACSEKQLDWLANVAEDSRMGPSMVNSGCSLLQRLLASVYAGQAATIKCESWKHVCGVLKVMYVFTPAANTNLRSLRSSTNTDQDAFTRLAGYVLLLLRLQLLSLHTTTQAEQQKQPTQTTATCTTPTKNATVTTPTKGTTATTPPKSSTISTPPKSSTVSTPPKNATVTTPTKGTTATTPPKSTTVTTGPKSTTFSTSPKSTTVTTPPKSTTVTTPPKSSIVSTPPRSSTVSTPPRSSTVSTPPRSSTVSTPPKNTTLHTATKTTQSNPSLTKSMQPQPHQQEADSYERAACNQTFQDENMQDAVPITGATEMHHGHRNISQGRQNTPIIQEQSNSTSQDEHNHINGAPDHHTSSRDEHNHTNGGQDHHTSRDERNHMSENQHHHAIQDPGQCPNCGAPAAAVCSGALCQVPVSTLALTLRLIYKLTKCGVLVGNMAMKKMAVGLVTQLLDNEDAVSCSPAVIGGAMQVLTASTHPNPGHLHHLILKTKKAWTTGRDRRHPRWHALTKTLIVLQHTACVYEWKRHETLSRLQSGQMMNADYQSPPATSGLDEGCNPAPHGMDTSRLQSGQMMNAEQGTSGPSGLDDGSSSAGQGMDTSEPFNYMSEEEQKRMHEELVQKVVDSCIEGTAPGKYLHSTIMAMCLDTAVPLLTRVHAVEAVGAIAQHSPSHAMKCATKLSLLLRVDLAQLDPGRMCLVAAAANVLSHLILKYPGYCAHLLENLEKLLHLLTLPVERGTEAGLLPGDTPTAALFASVAAAYGKVLSQNKVKWTGGMWGTLARCMFAASEQVSALMGNLANHLVDAAASSKERCNILVHLYSNTDTNLKKELVPLLCQRLAKPSDLASDDLILPVLQSFILTSSSSKDGQQATAAAALLAVMTPTTRSLTVLVTHLQAQSEDAHSKATSYSAEVLQSLKTFIGRHNSHHAARAPGAQPAGRADAPVREEPCESAPPTAWTNSRSVPLHVRAGALLDAMVPKATSRVPRTQNQKRKNGPSSVTTAAMTGMPGGDLQSYTTAVQRFMSSHHPTTSALTTGLVRERKSVGSVADSVCQPSNAGRETTACASGPRQEAARVGRQGRLKRKKGR